MELILTAIFAFLLAGLVKGVLGFGFPIIALVVLTLTLGLLDALAIIIVPTLITNIWQALSGPHLRAILERMWLYFLLSMIGILIASRYLAIVNVNWLTALLGIILCIFAVSRLLDIHITVARENERILSLILGSANGVLTGLTGTFMIPSVLYMQALGFGKDKLVQAMGAFFTASTLMLMISLGSNDLLSIDEAAMSAIALLPSFAGIYLGLWIRKRIDEDRFQKMFLVAVLLLGGYLVWRSAQALLLTPLS